MHRWVILSINLLNLIKFQLIIKWKLNLDIIIRKIILAVDIEPRQKY